MDPAHACRSCESTQLKTVLDLGDTPLANSLLTEKQLAEPEFKAPLAVVFCESCSLAQITHTIPPEHLFTDYAYFSSFSETMLRHSQSIAERLTSQRKLDGTSLVIEVASNDGYLLQYYKSARVPVLGIEPAHNIAVVAREKGIDTLEEFFGRDLGARLSSEGKRADIVHANNVFAHVPDINGFLAGLYSVLKDEGVAVIEFPYVGEMIEKVEFDTIYHEHVFYFSLTAVINASKRNGLTVVHVERLPIHGGSLRVFIARRGTTDDSVEQLLSEEQQLRLDQYTAYQDFACKVETLKSQLVSLLHDLKAAGKTIAGYGAAAKGSTLLNYTGVNGEILDFVVDRSTVKQGLYMPGVHLPILSPDELIKRKPDYVLLLTWNFASEIFAQQRAYLRQGGRFIVPVPSPRIFADSDTSSGSSDSERDPSGLNVFPITVSR